MPLTLLALLSTAFGAAPALPSAAIPAGTFVQGSGRVLDESPTREVVLSAYRIGLHEVTVGQFERFVGEGWRDDALWSAEGLAWRNAHPDGAGATLRASGRSADHPVVAVTWYEAAAFCRWVGGRLPTEAEWERAACHVPGERFPWGDAPVQAGVAWYDEGMTGHVDGVSTLPATVQDPALVAPTGLLHAAGNAWEWTEDTYHAASYQRPVEPDPVNRDPGPWKTLRGGSYTNLPSYCTCTHREPARPDQVRLTVGFRCAWGER